MILDFTENIPTHNIKITTFLLVQYPAYVRQTNKQTDMKGNKEVTILTTKLNTC